MASLPGYAGMPVVGDKSLEFYKDAVSFVDRRITQHGSRVFLTRILNKHTVIVASNSGVKQILNERDGCLELGYKSFMHGVYGENVLFTDGGEAGVLRNVLHSLFAAEKLEQFQETIDRLTTKALDKLNTGTPVDVYRPLKRLCTEICLSIFLDLDFETSASLAEDIVQLTTTHWHGIISVPMSLRIPGLGTSSSYTKALEAKTRLLEIIQARLEGCSEGFPAHMYNSDFPRAEHAAAHILLFTSALVPKALASLMTSFLIATGSKADLQEKMLSDKNLQDSVMLEVQRMWPPFFGGRRLVRKEMEIAGYKVQSGCAVIYMTRHAQRDPEVFKDPDTFDPERWNNGNQGDRDKLYLFGGGPRCCIGRHLVDNILQSVTRSLLEKFTWKTDQSADSVSYKWLPVSRPIETLPVVFTPRGTVSRDDKQPIETPEDLPAS